MLNDFWKRWHSEYLLNLRERFNVKNKSKLVEKGSVVLINDGLPRLQWKLGIIQELIPSLDGIVRSVKLKTLNGIQLRPITKLYPLELKCENCLVQSSDEIPNRPRRLAALQAREKFSSQLDD